MPLSHNNKFNIEQYAKMVLEMHRPEETAAVAEHHAYHQTLLHCIRDVINRNTTLLDLQAIETRWRVPAEYLSNDHTAELSSVIDNIACFNQLDLFPNEFNEARFMLMSQLVAGIRAHKYFVPNQAWQQCLIALNKLSNSIPSQTQLPSIVYDRQEDRLTDILRRLLIPSIIIFLSATARVKLSQTAFGHITDIITLAKRDGAPEEQLNALFAEKAALMQRQNYSYDMFVLSFFILMLQGTLFCLIIMLKHVDKPGQEHGLFRHRIATMPEQLAHEIAAISKRPQP